jgi:hypothetical protein
MRKPVITCPFPSRMLSQMSLPICLNKHLPGFLLTFSKIAGERRIG